MVSTWHQKGGKRAPRQLVYGRGESTATPEPESKDFAFDEASGLFLPEAAAKAKRQVEIGFRPRGES